MASIREDLLAEIEARFVIAERCAGAAEKWEELERRLGERGFPKMDPADVVKLIMPERPAELEVLLRMPLYVAAMRAASAEWMKGRNGHSEESGSCSEPGAGMPCNGGYNGRRDE